MMYANQALKDHGSDERIDYRSFVDQGKEYEIPTVHMGASATAIERKAYRNIFNGNSDEKIVFSEIGDINRQIRAHNETVRRLMRQMDDEIEKIKKEGEQAEETRRKATSLQEKLESAFLRKNALEKERARIIEQISRIKNLSSEDQQSILKVKTAIQKCNSRIQGLQRELGNCSKVSFKHRSTIKEEIHSEKERLQTLKEYLMSLENRISAVGSEDTSPDKEVKELTDMVDKIEGEIQEKQYIIEKYSNDFGEVAQTFELGSEALSMTAEGMVQIARIIKTEEQRNQPRRKH